MSAFAGRGLYLAYFAFACAVMIAAIGFVALVQRQQAIAFQAQMQTLVRTSEALAAHIESSVRAVLSDPPTAESIAAVQRLLDGYKALDDVFNIRLSRIDRQVVAAVRRKNLEKPESLPLMLAALEGQRGTSYESVDGTRNFCVAVPIEIGGKPWGAVVLYRNLEPAYATALAASTRIFWFTVATFALLLASIGALLWFAAREVRRAREAEAKQSRLALMGTMAASVAHEVRNPLNSLTLAIEYLKRRARAEDAAQFFPAELVEDLSAMQHEVHRLDQVVRDFSHLAKLPHIEPQTLTLDNSIEHVVKLFGPIAQQKGIRLLARQGSRDALVSIDPQRMEQVLINLVKNAVEATPNQGTVRIEADVDGDSLAVQVIDTGRGIAPEHQSMVFEPFYSTRSHGLGLGLFLSKRLVEAHHGTLTMTSERGKGTTFRISLPLAHPVADGAALPASGTV